MTNVKLYIINVKLSASVETNLSTSIHYHSINLQGFYSKRNVFPNDKFMVSIII